MKEYKIDVPVLMIFFCRPTQFKQVFERVKEARPSKLYLYQDGPRKDNPYDRALIDECRQIVCDDNIDWECEVHRLYQQENVGVDPSEYIAIKWMFQTEAKGIILEDDDIPDGSFFTFCKELLDRYENDDRVSFISGRNNAGVSRELNESYTFAGEGGAIWGWATWKRLVDTWDEHYSWLDDKEALDLIKRNIRNQSYDYFIETSSKRRQEGIAYYETILEASLCLHSGLYIIPKVNLIRSVGISENSVHNTADERLLPRRIRKLMNLPSYEMAFPLTHPISVEENKTFKAYKTMGGNKVMRLIEVGLLSIRYEGLTKALSRIKKWINKR